MHVAIIGSGPAGLAAAATIRADCPSAAITIFEKGRLARARICPVDRGQICDGCKGKCNVISGFGGSIHWGDAIKLSRFPSGRRLAALLGDNYPALEQRAMLLFGVNGACFSDSNLRTGMEGLRPYPVAELSEAEVQLWLLARHAAAIPYLRTRSRVLNVEQRVNGGFTVVSSAPSRDRRTEEFDAVIVATGRAGVSDCASWVSRIGVDRRAGTPSIGLRFELPVELLGPLYRIHRDYKISLLRGGLKVKSFCFSSHLENGGRLKYCHYQDQFGSPAIFLDGHMNGLDSDHASPVGNFALLVQTPQAEADASIFRYLSRFGGRPIWQPLVELISSSIGAKGSDQIRPSVCDIVRGDIRELFASSHLDVILAAFKEISETIAALTGLTDADVIAQTTVIAPAYEFFWDEIDVSPCFESNVKNLFFAGDCAGVAQGNLQAVISGIVVGDALANRII